MTGAIFGFSVFSTAAVVFLVMNLLVLMDWLLLIDLLLVNFFLKLFSFELLVVGVFQTRIFYIGQTV